MAKIIAGLVVLVLILVAAVWLIKTPAPSNTANAATDMKWNITELGEHSSAPGVPRTGVTLTAGGKTYPVGEFEGPCAEIDGTSWTYLVGEKTGVICWWAGGGNEVGVFEENGKLVLKIGVLDEGTAEIAGFRGDFQTIATIE